MAHSTENNSNRAHAPAASSPGPAKHRPWIKVAAYLLLIVAFAITAFQLVLKPSNETFSVVGYEFSQDAALTLFLGLCTLVVSFFGGSILTREQVREEILSSEAKHHKILSSSAATALNNLFQELSGLKRVWYDVTVRYQIDRAQQSSLESMIDHMMDVARGQINGLFSLTGDNWNPYNLPHFSNEVDCLVCGGRFVTDKVADHPKAKAEMRCGGTKDCKEILKVRRLLDGRLDLDQPVSHSASARPRASVPRDDEQVRVRDEPDERTVVSTRFDIACPHCNSAGLFKSNGAERQQLRGCVQCGKSFAVDVETRAVAAREGAAPQTVAQSDLTEAFGQAKVRCRSCGFLLNTLFFRKNRRGVRGADCHRCGAVLFDPNDIVPKPPPRSP